jgi:hypothetical protein
MEDPSNTRSTVLMDTSLVFVVVARFQNLVAHTSRSGSDVEVDALSGMYSTFQAAMKVITVVRIQIFQY